jgi:putative transposase
MPPAPIPTSLNSPNRAKLTLGVCRTHFMRNLLTRVPKSAQGFVATMVRSIFAQPDADTVHEQHRRIADQLEGRFPEAGALLEAAAADLLAFTGFPKEHWRQLWSNNSLERLNKEIRRRTDVVGIFPDPRLDRPSGRRPARRAARRMGRRPPLHERRVDHQSARRPPRRPRGGDGDRSSP